LHHQSQFTNSFDRQNLCHKYKTESQLLLHLLPDRLNSIIQACLDQIDLIFTLPMVLLHRDLRASNILVDEKSCHLTGVIDWAEAETCPFGQNLLKRLLV
jgi:Ser/Thr protein kinase RdoA (MazF antagonist)